MANFITVTDVTFLANYDAKTIQEPQKIVLNTQSILKFSTELNRYTFEDKVCTVIRTNINTWGFVVTETMEDLIKLINS